MFSLPLTSRYFKRHNITVVCTMKHPKKNDIMARVIFSLVPSWKKSVFGGGEGGGKASNQLQLCYNYCDIPPVSVIMYSILSTINKVPGTHTENSK